MSFTRIHFAVTAGAAIVMASLAVTPAAAQYTRVSVATDGTQANGPSADVQISSTGKFVVFASDASNLVPDDTNGVRDVFVRDLDGHTTTRVSVATDGAERSEPSGAPDRSYSPFVTFSGVDGVAISANGQIVAFESRAAFDAADTNTCGSGDAAAPCPDIYVRDLANHTTTRVSVATDGTQANGPSRRPRLSGDGRYVLFESDASNLVPNDTNNVTDIFVHDRVAHTTVRISVGPAGEQSTARSVNGAISSGNPSVYAFATHATAFGAALPADCSLTIADCQRVFVRKSSTGEVRMLPLSDGWAAFRASPSYGPAYSITGGINVVLNDNGSKAIVEVHNRASHSSYTTLEYHDLDTNVVKMGPSFGASGLGIAATNDGRYVAKAAGVANITEPTNNSSLTVNDMFAQTPEVVSSSDTGWNVSPSFTPDGRLLAFGSENTTLVAGDTNGVSDIFILDRDPDADGMPSAWETAYGLNPNNAADAALDPDGDGKTNLQEFQANTNPKGTHVRYFAEGAANQFFTTRFALANPTDTPASATVRLLGANGVQSTYRVPVAAKSRASLVPSLSGGAPDTVFSSVIESDQPLVADRLMTWDATGYGSSLETSSPAPGTTWYLAEGATGPSFSLYYLLQNPGDTDTTATVTYLLPTPQAPVTKTYDVPAHTRVTIDVTGEAPALKHNEISAKIVSGAPLAVERALYYTQSGAPLFNAGHAGAGIAAPATRWFLAEGATGFFDEYVPIVNAESTPANIKVTYLLEGLPDIPTIERSFSETFTVAANSRYTIDVRSRDPRLEQTPVSIIVESTNSVPVVVERVMWWPRAIWYENSLSAGVTATGTRWAFAEGEVSARLAPGPIVIPITTQTYVLIANTSPTTDGVATITLLRDGAAPLTKDVAIKANQRTSVDVGALFKGELVSGETFGIIVESDGVPIVAERAIYTSIGLTTYAAGATSVGTNLTPVP